MRDVDAQSYLENLKLDLEVESDKELAEALGVSRGTISSWRSRGTIPAHIRLKYDKIVDAIYHLRAEEERPWRRTEVLVNAIVYFLRDRYRDKIQFDTGEEELLFWGKLEPVLKLAIRDETSFIREDSDLTSALKDIVHRVEHSDLFTFSYLMTLSRRPDLD